MPVPAEARIDALVMEQATRSPFVANVFGFCGTSQVLEHSAKGNLYDRVKLSRMAEADQMKPIDKLKILIHIASVFRFPIGKCFQTNHFGLFRRASSAFDGAQFVSRCRR